jgi:type III secretion system FlhB-like substrate exporter
MSADLEIGDPAAPKQRTGRQAAIALEHRRGSDKTPTIVAQGYGKIAEAILAMAFDNDVKVREDPDLAEVLMAVDLGEDIPIEGRICALADVFDALLSKRPYKEPFSPEKVREIIAQERGKHFEPRLVDAFLGSYDEFLAIMGLPGLSA